MPSVISMSKILYYQPGELLIVLMIKISPRLFIPLMIVTALIYCLIRMEVYFIIILELETTGLKMTKLNL
jgi:hypothetical protein